MTPRQRVCVIGAQGTLGRAVVNQFASTGWTVYPAGRRPDEREGFRFLDLDRPETVLSAVRDVDLVVSTVPHPELTAERLVLERGGVLINCSHAPAQTAAAITMEAKGPKGTILLNAGLVPGIANLAAAELLEKHPQADCLEVAFTILNKGTAGKAGGEFAYEGLTSQPHHRVVKLPMPGPFGKLACIEVAEGDDFGFGGVAKSRRIEVSLGFADSSLGLTLRTINTLRLMRILPKAAFVTTRGEQADASREPTAVWIGARRGSKRLGASVLECEGDYRTTATATRVFGERLIGHNQPGCFNPEDLSLFSLSDLLPAFDDVGLRITQNTADNFTEEPACFSSAL